MRRSRHQRALGAAVVLALGLVLWAAWPADGAAPTPPVVERASRLGADDRESPALHVRTADRGPRTPPPLDEGPVIEQVIVDKPEVCRGEPVTVEVVARDARGETGDIYTLVDGHRANPAVLSYDSEGERIVPVAVFDRRGAGHVDRQEVAVRVRACDQRTEWLEVDVRFLPGLGVHSFVARRPGALTDAGAQQLSRASFRWDFGDGTEDSGGGAAEHRYDDRNQRTVMRTFLVKVEAKVGEKVLRGRTTVTQESLYLANRQRGMLTPDVRVGATRREGSEYRATIEIGQFETSPLETDRASVNFVPCRQDEPAPASVEGIWAEQYLWTRALAPGWSTVTLRYPMAAVPEGTCLVQFAFQGTSNAGQPVYWNAHLKLGAFAGGPPSAQGANAPKEERAILARALALLGRQGQEGAYVTQEELELLRRQGKL